MRSQYVALSLVEGGALTADSDSSAARNPVTRGYGAVPKTVEQYVVGNIDDVN